MAQSKITKIEDVTYQGKVTGHLVFLEDNTNGYLDDKNSDNLTVGDIADYTLAVKKNKRGGEYNLLTLKRAVTSATVTDTPPPKGHSPIPNITLFQEKVKGVLKSMELTIQAVCEDKINFDKVKENFKEINVYVQDAIDEIASEI